VKVVAVSQRVDVYRDRGERRDALDQRLGLWLYEAGYLPVSVPNYLAPGSTCYSGRLALLAWCDRIGVDGIILSGGNDIGSAPGRDATEVALLDLASKRSLPLLGICRGMQMMAVWAGATLTGARGHVRTRHQLSGAIGGSANSYHTVCLAFCPEPFRVMARSEDGAIEAMAHARLPWEGWMWHPERESEFDPRDIQRLTALFGIAGLCSDVVSH
jgi:putative glutamine amidotransferase